MQPRILSIDDAIDHQQIIAATFNNQYSLTQAFTLGEAEKILDKQDFDLILLDVTLPDGDGFSFYAKLQSSDRHRGVSTIFLTSRTEVASEVMGFSLGADDFIVKPIQPARLRARIEAHLKQLNSRKHQEMILQKGNLKVSVSLQRVIVLHQGKELPVDLTPVEFKLLFHLLRHEEHVFTRSQLLETVWGNDASEVFDRTVDMHVSNLRKKIVLSNFKIQAVHGTGYRLVRGNSASV